MTPEWHGLPGTSCSGVGRCMRSSPCTFALQHIPPQILHQLQGQVDPCGNVLQEVQGEALEDGLLLEQVIGEGKGDTVCGGCGGGRGETLGPEKPLLAVHQRVIARPPQGRLSRALRGNKLRWDRLRGVRE